MPFDIGFFGIAVILGGIAFGVMIFKRRGHQRGRTASAALSAITGVFWTLAGIFTVIGGYWLVGAILIAFFVYISLSNAKEVDERTHIRSRIAGRR